MRESLKHFVEGSSENPSTHLTGSRSNLIELGIPQEPASTIVIDVTITTWREGKEGEGY